MINPPQFRSENMVIGLGGFSANKKDDRNGGLRDFSRAVGGEVEVLENRVGVGNLNLNYRVV